MAAQTSPSLADVVDRLHRNRSIIAALADGTTRRDALADVADVSEKTVYRRLRRLEDAGIVRRRGSELALTTTGALLDDAHRGLLALARTVDGHGDALDAVDAGRLPPRCVLESASVRTPPERAPARLYQGLAETLADADATAAYVPTVADRYLRVLADALDGDDSLYLPPSVVDLLEDDPGVPYDALAADPRVHLVRDDAPPFVVQVTRAPTELVVLLPDDHGAPRVRLDADDAAAVGWAREFLARLDTDPARTPPEQR